MYRKISKKMFFSQFYNYICLFKWIKALIFEYSLNFCVSYGRTTSWFAENLFVLLALNAIHVHYVFMFHLRVTSKRKFKFTRWQYFASFSVIFQIQIVSTFRLIWEVNRQKYQDKTGLRACFCIHFYVFPIFFFESKNPKPDKLTFELNWMYFWSGNKVFVILKC